MIKLNQINNRFVFSEMRWECDEITKVINEYYGNLRKPFSYLTVFEIYKDYTIDNSKWCIIFDIRVPGATIGYVKCKYDGKIVEIKIYNDFCEDDTLSYAFNTYVVGQYIDSRELSKIKFVYDNISINYKVDKQIIWFIANFLYHLDLDYVESIRSQFRTGYCLHFAMMLKDLFKTGEICWYAPYGHMIYMHNGIPYDIEGINTSDCKYYIPISYIQEGIRDFVRIPGVIFDASEDYIQKVIAQYEIDNGITN